MENKSKPIQHNQAIVEKKTLKKLIEMPNTGQSDARDR